MEVQQGIYISGLSKHKKDGWKFTCAGNQYLNRSIDPLLLLLQKQTRQNLNSDV